MIKKVVVLGDVMVDRTSQGTVARLSPEAPVPIVDCENPIDSAGGACRVVSDLKDLGLDPHLISRVGNDSEGDFIERWCEGFRISHDFLRSGHTIVKHRVLAGDRQLIRLDIEHSHRRGNDWSDIIKKVNRCSDKPFVISDYSKGTIPMNILDRLKSVVVIDPGRGRDLRFYGSRSKVWYKMNRVEAKELHEESKHSILDTHPQDILSECLPSESRDCIVIITKGEKGAVVSYAEGSKVAPAYGFEPWKQVHVSSIVGAGDCAAAALMKAILIREETERIEEINEIVQEMIETASYRVSDEYRRKKSDLRAHAQSARLNFIQGWCNDFPVTTEGYQEEMSRRFLRFKQWGGQIAVCGGCFDGLHSGHVNLFKEARGLVGPSGAVVALINSDESIRKLKGEGRPFMHQTQRITLLLSMRDVDAVIPFKGNSTIPYLKLIKPDYFVKGADRNRSATTELGVMEELGGKVVYTTEIPGLHNREILKVPS